MDAGAPGRLRSVPTETKLVVGLVSGAELVNHMYLVLFPPLLGVLAADFGVSLFLLGVAMGAQGLTNTAFQLPFGYLSDSYDRTLALGLSLGLGTLGVFVVALAPSYPALLVGQLVLGLGVAGHHPTHFPLLAEATPEDLRGRAFSMRGFAGNVGFATPPVVVTAVLGVEGLTWRHAVALVGLAGAAYAAVTLFAFVRYVDPAVRRGGGGSAADEDRSATDEGGSATDEGGSAGASIASRALLGRARAELRSLRASPAIVALSLLSFLAAMAGWGVTTYTVVLLTDGYGVGRDVANFALTGIFLAGAVMTLVGGDLADRFAPGPVILATFATVGALVALFGSLAIPPAAALAVALCIGGVRALGGPARSKLTDAFSGRGELGVNFAVITVGTMVGGALAPPLFGAVIDFVAVRTAFFLIAGFAFVALLVTAGIIYAYGDGTATGEAAPGAD